jgi:hypothetical protein
LQKSCLRFRDLLRRNVNPLLSPGTAGIRINVERDAFFRETNVRSVTDFDGDHQALEGGDHAPQRRIASVAPRKVLIAPVG